MYIECSFPTKEHRVNEIAMFIDSELIALRGAFYNPGGVDV
jgi:hypothetical protein